jgi:glycosyltransferase involved in cell wall biosynthesis
MIIHYNFIFSDMPGVQKKLKDMSKSTDKFHFRVIDLSDAPRFISLFLAFWKGFFISPTAEKIIIRHNFVDFSLLFLLLLRCVLRRKTYLEHHSNHLTEFRRRGVFGRAMSARETILLRVVQPFITGNIFVSDSVLQQLQRYVGKNNIIMENGINWPQVAGYRDLRKFGHTDGKIRTIFVAGKFAQWHGLDILINAIKDDEEAFSRKFELTIVGDVSNYKLPENVRHIPYLSPHDLYLCLADCDLAIDSLALSRLGLTTSSSLKGKEYIALGLPILCESYSNDKYRAFSYLFDGDFARIANWHNELDMDRLSSVSLDLAKHDYDWKIVLNKLAERL